MNPLKMTVLELLIVIFLIFVLLLCMMDGLSIILGFFFGWYHFLARLVPGIRLDASWIVWILIFGGLTLAGGHELFCRLHQRSDPSAPRWRLSQSLRLTALLGLLVVMGLATSGIFQQLVWLRNGPEPLFVSGRHLFMNSQNNLKHLGLSALSHVDEKKLLPSASFDVNGNVLHGWPVLLLPYLEQPNLASKIKYHEPWNSAKNQEVFRTKIEIFEHGAPRSGSLTESGLAPMEYASNIYLLAPGGPKTLHEIKDGTSNTLMMGEVCSNIVPWGSPFHWRDPTLGLNRVPHGFGAPFGRRPRVIFALADGSVRVLTTYTSPVVLKALATPNGGEPAEEHADR